MNISAKYTALIAIFIFSTAGCGRNSEHMPVNDGSQLQGGQSEQGAPASTGVGETPSAQSPPKAQQQAPLLTYDKDIAPIFKNRCGLCHTGKGLPDWTVYKSAFAKSAEIVRRIHLPAGNSQTMPPGNVTGLTDPERKLIQEWVNGGAPRLDKNGNPV